MIYTARLFRFSYQIIKVLITPIIITINWGTVMKVERGLSISVVVLMIILQLQIFFIPGVKGDGAVIIPESLEFEPEKEQTAIITLTEERYGNPDIMKKYQRTIISIDINNVKGRGAFWVYPVSGNPDEVYFEILEDFPDIKGYNNKDKDYEESAEGLKWAPLVYHFSSFFPFFKWLYFNVEPHGDVEDEASSVIVHKQIDQLGFHSELVSSENGVDVYNYLNEKNLSVDSGMINQLDY